MTRVLTIALLVIVLAATAVFYGFNKVRNLAQISDPAIDSNLTAQGEGKLLPLAPDVTPYPQFQLLANAYDNFVRLFNDIDGSGLALIEPVAGFKEHITKKTFGLYVTPETSPVENDRFTGYHTGVDSEFSDTQEEIPVRAIADGTIIVSTWAKGYGGVVVIKHIIKNVPVFAIYGHLDKASFPASDGKQVKAGDRIGILGDDHSEETDGVRKHLHFSIYIGEKLDMRGYVQSEEELSSWLNPLDFYEE